MKPTFYPTITKRDLFEHRCDDALNGETNTKETCKSNKNLIYYQCAGKESKMN